MLITQREQFTLYVNMQICVYTHLFKCKTSANVNLSN